MPKEIERNALNRKSGGTGISWQVALKGEFIECLFLFSDTGERHKAEEIGGELIANRLFSPPLLENRPRSAAVAFHFTGRQCENGLIASIHAQAIFQRTERGAEKAKVSRSAQRFQKTVNI